MPKDDLTFRAMLADMPTWLKVVALIYGAGMAGLAYIVLHFVIKHW